jgi:hypothetical protein
LKSPYGHVAIIQSCCGENKYKICEQNWNDKFTDSVVFKSVPRYITNTLDSLKTFEIENVKAGKYLLVAMKDANSNNKFNPKDDKIGFRKQLVTIPNDSLFELKLFKEVLPFKTVKPFQTTGNKLILG